MSPAPAAAPAHSAMVYPPPVMVAAWSGKSRLTSPGSSTLTTHMPMPARSEPVSRAGIVDRPRNVGQKARAADRDTGIAHHVDQDRDATRQGRSQVKHD